MERQAASLDDDESLFTAHGVDSIGLLRLVGFLEETFGIEILDIDLRQPLPDETIAEIRALWNEHGIVLLRGQDITPQQLIDYSRRFGELDLHETLKPFRHPEHAELFVLSTIPVDGKPSVSENVGRHWHSDLSYTLRPPLGSIFHAQILPDVGGDTMFASMYAAYDALSPRMKTYLEGLTATHDGTRVFGPGTPVSVHPVIVKHPASGRKVIFVNTDFTAKINELPRLEGERVLPTGYEP